MSIVWLVYMSLIRLSPFCHHLQHIPLFLSDPDEADDYFNLPRRIRLQFLSKLYAAGVRYLFTGHLHRNCEVKWAPDANLLLADPLHLITTSSATVPLGDDPPGIRLVHVTATDRLEHAYWSLDDLETHLLQGKQPIV